MLDVKGGSLENAIKKNSEMISMIFELLSGSKVGLLMLTLSLNMNPVGAFTDADATLALGNVEIEFYGKLFGTIFSDFLCWIILDRSCTSKKSVKVPCNNTLS